MPASSRRLFVSHRTEFVYAGTAQESVNEVRLAPISGGGQSVEHARLTVSPAADVAEWDDVFGNRVWWFQVVEPHERLVVQAETVVQTAARGTTAAVGDVGQWDVIASAGYRDRWAEFLLPSALVTWSAQTTTFAERLVARQAGGVDEWAIRLAHRLNDEFVYERGVTDTTSAVDDVIGAGRGVCQDFAHVFVALCRMRGVAAQYVSGWLYEPERLGPVESHAWAAVQIPGAGWLELDPTHPGEVDDRYVRVAVGRDYEDVVPVRGTYLGAPTETMNVQVELRELGVHAAI